MLEKAFDQIEDGTSLILHSYMGWQYQHKHYQKMLKAKGICQSMSRKGNCIMTSSFANKSIGFTLVEILLYKTIILDSLMTFL